MHIKGTIYGKFISVAPVFYGDRDLEFVQESKNSRFAVLEGGEVLASCFFGRIPGFKEHCIYNFSSRSNQKDVMEFLLASVNNALIQAGHDKMLACADNRAIADALAGFGMCKVAEPAHYPGRPYSFCPYEGPAPLLEGLKERLRLLFPPLASTLYHASSEQRRHYALFSGRVAGKSMTVLFTGEKYLLKFYPGMVFEDKHPKPLGAGPLRGEGPKDADIIFRFSHGDEPPKTKNTLVLPAAVDCILSPNSTFEEYLKTLPHSAASDTTKIRKAGFGVLKSSNPVDLLLFYKTMYLPAMAERHMEHQGIVSYAEACSYFNKGLLLLIKKDNAPVAGGLVTDQGSRLQLKILGSLPGKAPRGNAAIVYFFLKHAFESGRTTADFGITPPFCLDSLFKFKKKWGTRAVRSQGVPETLYLSFRNEEIKKIFCDNKKPILLSELGPMH